MSTPRPPIRVAHLIHDLRRGGAEHVLVDLATAAAAAGIEMSVVSMRPVESFPYARDLKARGVRLDTLGLTAWWDPRGPRLLRSLLSRLPTDVLHTHLKHADVVGGRVAADLEIPHVSTLHLIEDEVGWVAGRKRDVAMRSRSRTTAVTIAVSDAVRDWYLEASGADPWSVVTIHNGVPEHPTFDREEVEAVRRRLGAPDGGLIGLMVAVMRPGKGHDILLDAIRLLDRSDVYFVLAGDGPDASRVMARASEIPTVVCTGFRDDVELLLTACDFVVHPSLFDALPTALIHGLAAGRPIVASAVGGIPEIVSPGVGELVAPGDPDALAAAIDRVVADPDHRRWMGKQARERFEQEFTASAWVDRLRAVYESVLNQP